MLSGKFVLRLDPRTHKALKNEARTRGESLNSVCQRKLRSHGGSQGNSQWNEVCERVVSEFAPRGIVLFGSVARGEETKGSDVDFLVVLPEDQVLSRDLYRRWDQIFLKEKRELSPQFVHLPQVSGPLGSIWLEVAIEGEILYDSNSALRSVLFKIRSQIAEGNYLRKVSHGHPYWVRQDLDAK